VVAVGEQKPPSSPNALMMLPRSLRAGPSDSAALLVLGRLGDAWPSSSLLLLQPARTRGTAITERAARRMRRDGIGSALHA
jgi:hypothetical protein